MKTPILAVGVLALLSAPVLVPPMSAAAQSSQSADQLTSSNRITVAAARSIVGETVRDKNGKDLGTVEYLLIGVDDARVRLPSLNPKKARPASWCLFPGLR